jgi:hypothetical protein
MNFEEPAKPLLTEPGVKYFLNQAKKQSLNYKQILERDLMLKRISS